MSSRLSLFFVVFFTAAMASARSFPPGLKTYAERYHYLDTLRIRLLNTDSALAVREYDQLIEQAKHQGNRGLAFHLEKLKFDRQVSDYLSPRQGLDTRKRIEHIEKAYPLLAAEWYHLLGSKYWNRNDYTRGLELELKAYEIYKDKTVQEFPPRVNVQHTLATRYYSFAKYKKAKYYLLELQHADTGSLYTILTGGRYNTLALTYLKLGQTDSALWGFRQIYMHELERNAPVVAAIAAGNIGHTYYHLGAYDSAIHWLNEENNIVQARNRNAITQNIIMSALALSDIYVQKGNLAEAQRNMTRAERLMQGLDLRLSGRLEYYLVHARLNKAQGLDARAYTYMDSARMYTDSLNREMSGTKIKEAEEAMERVHAQLKLQELDYARAKSVVIRNFIILMVILMAVIALLLLNKRRQWVKQRQYIMERKQEEIETELEKAKKRLDVFTQSIHVKNQLIEQFTGEIERLTNIKIVADQKETIMQLQGSTILTDEEWDEFRILFEKVHGGFLQRLREKYPEITPAETRYIALVKLDLSNKEMANILGTGTTAIRNYKYRLRKKLDLPDEESFEDMIARI